MLVPEFILENFEIYGAKEYSNEWVIELREKEGLIPTPIASCDDVVFDGYERTKDVRSHSFVCKPVYLRIYRRRYKRKCADKHYSNTYDFTLKGIKMVPELGIFLKESDRIFSDSN
jgi:hypothetical protein